MFSDLQESREKSNQEMVGLTVQIPKALKKRLQLACLDVEMTIQDFTASAIDSALQKVGK